MSSTEFDARRFGLIFDFSRSARYHDHRRAFFELMQRITNLLTIFLAGNVLYALSLKTEVASAWWMSAIALAGAFMAACDLVVGFSRMIILHSDLKNAYTALEIEAKKCAAEEQALNHLESQREITERKEPGIYRALDALCYNETVCSLFDEDKQIRLLKKIPWYMRITRHLIQWSNIAEVSIKSKSQV